MKVLKVTLAAATVVFALLGATAAFGWAATTVPTGGTIHLFDVEHVGTGTSTILFTGAIGDHGRTYSIDKDGKVDPSGHYLKVVLQDGSFEANTVAFDKTVGGVTPTSYNATCSAQFVATSPVTFFGGTGSYKGISGTVEVTNTAAFVLPRYNSGEHAGQCNQNANPLALYSTDTGSGKVSFGQ